MDRLELARQLLGQGLLGRTADISKLQPIWNKEYIAAQISGEDYPQFNDWYKELNQHALTLRPTMKRGMAMSDL